MRSSLSRFIEAQQDTYQAALSELQSGNGEGVDMVHIPQLHGLGRSETCNISGISDIAGKAYLQHPTLGLAYSIARRVLCWA
jgi:uncharacterized protein (DUF1810 family)